MSAVPEDYHTDGFVALVPGEATFELHESSLEITFASGRRAVIHGGEDALIGVGGEAGQRDGAKGGVYRADVLDSDGQPLGLHVIKRVPRGLGRTIRTQREAELLWDVGGRFSQLGRPRRTPYVLDFAENERFACLLMEYIPGRTLEEEISAGIGLGTAFDYADQLLAILEVLQTELPPDERQGLAQPRKPITHGDLDPKNIIVSGGQLYLSDFGAAFMEGERDPAPLQPWGKPIWMPRERANGTKKFDSASDPFGVGSLLLEMISRGRYSQRRRTGSSLATMVATESGAYLHTVDELLAEHPTEDYPDVPMAVRHVIRTAMAHNSSERYSTAHALRAALHEAVWTDRRVPAMDAAMTALRRLVDFRRAVRSTR